jgi:hypothetical protein
MKKSVIFGGYRHTVESPRKHHPDAELWMQSNSIRAWDFCLHDWSRWFDVHDVEFQPGYPGIRMLRPDILEWYGRQGRERPIYFASAPPPQIIGGVLYPRAEMEAAFGPGRFGCQLDFMFALALYEKFERIILYGNGAPYVDKPTNDPARRKWIDRHSSALWWIGKAEERGVEMVYDGPCMYRPFTGAYGYDMGLGADVNGVDVER